jgi:energy-coupling factor transporter ATP-binding protein EcfA2
MVPPLPRLPQARGHVEKGDYFVLHAPRQSGKTTFLRHFAKALTSEGTFCALYMSCEAAESKGDDDVAAQEVIVRQLLAEAELQLEEGLRPPPIPEGASPERLLTDVVTTWCKRCPRRVVLFLDEIDAVRGQSLIAVLRQLRAMFPDRPTSAPWSVMLCGLRDVREYKTASGGDGNRLGTASLFNVKVASLTFSNFTEEEVRDLLQHTAETGQTFEEEAVEGITESAGGQPWLVNALARELVEEMQLEGPVAAVHLEAAKERLILARATHLDSLVSKLSEPRVRRVIQPILAGETVAMDDVFDDDLRYVLDLGLVKSPPLRMANPIYTEVVARVLSAGIQHVVMADPRSFVRADGRFDIGVLLREFSEFWVENGPIMTKNLSYQEAAPQLVLMAFLQRVVNGGGTVTREYGIGRKRIDLLVSWPWVDEHGKKQLQREAIELKVWRDGRKDPLAEGLKQIDAYLTGLGLEEGVLVLFDQRTTAIDVEERTHEEAAETASGKRIRVLRA